MGDGRASRIRGMALGAVLCVVIVGCDSGASPRPTDPREILANGIRTTAGLSTLRLHVQLGTDLGRAAQHHVGAAVGLGEEPVEVGPQRVAQQQGPGQEGHAEADREQGRDQPPLARPQAPRGDGDHRATRPSAMTTEVSADPAVMPRSSAADRRRVVGQARAPVLPRSRYQFVQPGRTSPAS